MRKQLKVHGKVQFLAIFVSAEMALNPSKIEKLHETFLLWNPCKAIIKELHKFFSHIECIRLNYDWQYYVFFFISFKVKERDAILPEELLKMQILKRLRIYILINLFIYFHQIIWSFPYFSTIHEEKKLSNIQYNNMFKYSPLHHGLNSIMISSGCW